MIAFLGTPFHRECQTLPVAKNRNRFEAPARRKWMVRTFSFMSRKGFACVNFRIEVVPHVSRDASRCMMLGSTCILRLLPGAATETSGCRLDDGLCICEDNGGTIWDVTALGVGDKVAKGPADGCTICVGEWNYHLDICGNVGVPDALGCSSTALASAYRVDEYTTPTSRSCELLGPDVEGSGTLGVAALTGRQQGVQLTYTYLQRALRLNL
eukprot:COSAG05_NODE_4779_length_1376_cov_1.377447_1_plen_211_part_10